MTFNTLIIALTLIVSISIFIISVTKPEKTIAIILYVIILAHSFILNGQYAAIDEVLAGSALAGYLLSTKRDFKLYSTKLKINIVARKEIIFILYLLVNTIISLISHRELSSVRYLLIFLEVYFISSIFHQNQIISTPVLKIILYCFRIYLAIWLAYYFWAKVLGIDWQVQQSITWAGSSYAAFPAVVGAYFHILAFKAIKCRQTSLNLLLYCSGLLFASQIYLSRVVFFSILLAFLIYMVLIITEKNLKLFLINFTAVMAIFLITISASNEIMAVKTTTAATTAAQIGALEESSKFLYNPRASDQDRYLTLFCARNGILNAQSFQHKVFGFGQNQHKTELIQCPEIQKLLHPDQKVLRPVGAAGFVVDFGLVGVFLGFLLILRNIFTLVRNFQEYWITLIMYLQVVSWSLITNLNDSLLLYLLILIPPKIYSESMRPISGKLP